MLGPLAPILLKARLYLPRSPLPLPIKCSVLKGSGTLRLTWPPFSIPQLAACPVLAGERLERVTGELQAVPATEIPNLGYKWDLSLGVSILGPSSIL